MKKLLSYISLAYFIVSALSSCEDNYTICNQSKEVNCKGIFFKKTGGADVETPVSSLTIKPLTATTFLYFQQPGISAFTFALNPVLDSAKYIFKIDNSISQDTISLFYTSQLLLISAECGNIITHQLSNAKTTKNLLDSVRIINPKVDNVSTTNLKVFFH